MLELLNRRFKLGIRFVYQSDISNGLCRSDFSKGGLISWHYFFEARFSDTERRETLESITESFFGLIHFRVIDVFG